jgi:hypothetical protein
MMRVLEHAGIEENKTVNGQELMWISIHRTSTVRALSEGAAKWDIWEWMNRDHQEARKSSTHGQSM